MKDLHRLHLFRYSWEHHDLNTVGDFPNAEAFLDRLGLKPEALESLFYISTCNRAEAYLQTREPMTRPAAYALWQNILRQAQITTKAKPQYLIGDKVLKHMISSMSGLKSMALGETQITGQFKRALEAAILRNMLSQGFINLLHKSLAVQKRIRHSTGIGRESVSILNLLQKRMRFLDFHGQKAVLFGTGDMARKALKFLTEKGFHDILILRKSTRAPLNPDFAALLQNRKSRIRIESLEILNSLPADYRNFQADIIVGSGIVDNPIFTKSQYEILKTEKFLSNNTLFADLGLPPNFSRELERLHEKERLIDLRTLQEESESNLEKRRLLLEEAEEIIEESMQELRLEMYLKKYPQVSLSIRDAALKAAREHIREYLNAHLLPASGRTQKESRIIADLTAKTHRKILREYRKELTKELGNMPACLPPVQPSLRLSKLPEVSIPSALIRREKARR